MENNDLNKNENQTINYNNLVNEALDKIDKDKAFFKHNKKAPIKEKISKKKLIIIICVSVLLITLLTITIIFKVRTSNANKFILNLQNENYYSEKTIENKLKEEGYNSLEINYALKKADINFVENLKNRLALYIKEPEDFLSKNSFITMFKEDGFKDEEIDEVISGLDYKSFLKEYLDNYVKFNKNKTIKKQEFLEKLEKSGFEKSDIEYINGLDIWNSFAEEYLKDFFNKNTSASKDEAHDYLVDLGFKEDDIDSIFLKVDWNKQALACITGIVNEVNEENKTSKTKKEVTIKLIKTRLKEKGFADDEIKYAVENYDFSNVLVDKINTLIKAQGKTVNITEITKTLKTSGYDKDSIEKAIEKITWTSYCSSTLIQTLSINKANKAEALKTLKEYGYNQDDIDDATSKVKWAEYCYKALNYMEDNNSKSKDQLLDILEDYGYSDEEILTAKKNTSWSLFAYNYLKNKVSSEELNRISPKEVESILNKADYSDQVAYVKSKFNWTNQASNYLKYTLDSYLNTPETFNYSDISGKMSELGFSSFDTVFKDYKDDYTLKWANAYVDKNDLPNKDSLIGSLDSMKLNSSLDKLNDLYKTVAEKIINNNKEDKDKETMENFLKDLKYDQADYEDALNEAYPSQD